MSAHKKIPSHGSRMLPEDSNTSVDPTKFVDECLSVLLQLFVLYGFEADGYKTANTRAHFVLLMQRLGGEVQHAVKLIKYKLAAFAAAWLEQELPPSPFPDGVVDNPKILLQGRADRYVRLVMRGKTHHKPLGFIASVLYAKKGMPRPPTSMVREAEVKTEKVLTTPPLEMKPIEPLVRGLAWSDPWFETEGLSPGLMPFGWADVERELRRTVRECFSDREFTLLDRMAPMFPSTSANYNLSRSKLGAVGELLSARLSEDFEGLLSDSHPVTWKAVRGEEYIGAGPYVEAEIDLVDLEFRAGRLYERLLTRAMKEPKSVKAVGLPEALKVRVISKGPPVTYYVLKALQQCMWSTLASMPTFALTGTPVTPEILKATLGALEADESYLSADYEAATDNLHPRVSRIVAEEISECLKLRPEERQLFIDALVHHIFPSGPQLSGQLMGSIVSFPVLCLANAAMCRFARELDVGRSLSLDQAQILINGDDAVMKVGRAGQLFWQRVTAFIGLKPSVGKVYYSRDFLNINSTMFDTRAGAYDMVKYVNLGLLFGLKRSGGAAGLVGDESSSLGSKARELWTACPDYMRQAVMAKWFSLHMDVLRRYSLPWAIPEALGGLGLPGCVPTALDLKVARSLLSEGVVPGPLSSQATWKVRQLALKEVPLKLERVALPAGQHAELWESAVSWMGVGLLFTKKSRTPEFQSKIYKDLAAQSGARQLRERERLWLSRIRKGKIYSTPDVSANIDGPIASHADTMTIDYSQDDWERSILPSWAWTRPQPLLGVAISSVVSVRHSGRLAEADVPVRDPLFSDVVQEVEWDETAPVKTDDDSIPAWLKHASGFASLRRWATRRRLRNLGKPEPARPDWALPVREPTERKR